MSEILPYSLSFAFSRHKRFFLYAVMMLASFCFIKEGKTQSHQPNIILILGDDIGYKALGVNGGISFSTPNLDNMAMQGMNFTECHASPLCSPSRFMLLTGKYNFRNYTKWGIMDTSQRTIGNMFKDAGYKTAYFGKWQLDGGEESIRTFGFDNYCVYRPFEDTGKGEARYKSPMIYTGGGYVSEELTENKYSEDIFADSVMNFIENNKANPFFIYYPMALAHKPFQPTPDDKDFAKWKSKNASDTSYFPSMIKYMDKKVGEIINKVKQAGIENNTIIIYLADNGTPPNILEYTDDGSIISGGKFFTTENGTHVPMIVYWPGTVNAGSINNDLVDFTDFLPSLAGVAGIPVPDYGPLDGVSFAPRLTGDPGTPRQSIFSYYQPHPKTDTAQIWAQTTTYKLYDTSGLNTNWLFYNIETDPDETNPIPDELLTPEQAAIKQQLMDIINGYIAQGLPLLDAPEVISVADSTAIITNSIESDGASTITASGIVWSTDQDPVLSTGNYTAEDSTKGMFNSFITGLAGNTKYYIRTYATNRAGTAYSKGISITTPINPPVCTDATEVSDTEFTANWNALSGADSYKVDVSTLPEFSIVTPVSVAEGFDSGTYPPPGWIFSGGLLADTTKFGSSSPSLRFHISVKNITTAKYPEPVSSFSFWLKGSGKNAGSLLVEGFDGFTWKTIENITNITQKAVIKTYDPASSPAMGNNFIQFRFTFTKATGYISFDDVHINYAAHTPSFLPGYEDLTVTGNSQPITGIRKNRQYYYRVRAENINGASRNSNTIKVLTCKKPSISNITVTNLNCNKDSSGAINLAVTGDELLYKWSGPDDFISSKQNIYKLAAGAYHVSITSFGACEADTTIIITEPLLISATASAGTLTCTDNTTTLTIAASGGTGKYYYTLSGGTTTTGPQQDNEFTVGAGNYTVMVEDDNHCSFTTPVISIKNNSTGCDTLNEEFLVKVFPNPAVNEFNLSIQSMSNKPIQVVATDLYGHKVYQASAVNNGRCVFGKNFAPGIYFVQVIQNGFKKTIKLIKQ